MQLYLWAAHYEVHFLWPPSCKASRITYTPCYIIPLRILSLILYVIYKTLREHTHKKVHLKPCHILPCYMLHINTKVGSLFAVVYKYRLGNNPRMTWITTSSTLPTWHGCNYNCHQSYKICFLWFHTGWI